MQKLANFLIELHIRFTQSFKRDGAPNEGVKIGICLIALYMWGFQVVFCFALGIYIDSLICLIDLIGISVLLFLYKAKIGKSDTIFGLICFLTVLGLIGVNVNAGMQVNPSMMFFCAVPLFSIPLCGFKWGTIWSVVSMSVSSLLMFLAHTYTFTWNEFNKEQWYQVGLSNLSSGPILMLGIFGYYYLTNKRLSNELLEKRLSLELQYRENEKLFRILSHDVGRNVALLSANLEILDANKQLPSRARMSLKYITNIKKILLNNSSSKDEDSPLKEQIDFESILNDCLAGFQSKINERNLSVNYIKKSDFSPLVNPVHFRVHLLDNLISNAVKYCFEGSTIEVVSEESKVTITTQGIEFDPGATHQEKGSGFGLPIVREFSRLNNLELIIETSGTQTKTILKALE